jgi:iron complex outermembrane receptor protein
MKQIFTTVFMALCSVIAIAQSNFSGSIISESKQQVATATIVLKNKTLNKSTTASSDGSFSFDNLSKAIYTITVTAVGYEVYSDVVNINENIANYKVTLISKNAQLQAVEVVGRATKKYNSDYSFSATKTAALIKDIPQSIGTVTKELIADRQAFQLADAVKIIPGVIPNSFYNQYAIRVLAKTKRGKL